MSIQKLIDQTYSYFVEAQNTPLADLYEDDLSDFQCISTFLNMEDYNGVLAKLDNMDTEPREAMIVAMISDLGQRFVAKTFGYGVV